VAVKTVHFQGWQDAVELTNGDAVVVVVPAVGRILHYSLADGKNALWTDGKPAGSSVRIPSGLPREWMNYGGDKLWPTPQEFWPLTNGAGWPPDPWFDGSAHPATLLEDGVEIIGPVSAFNGARSHRAIRLAERGAALRIRQRIEKVRPAADASVEPVAFTAWSVTQIRLPEQVLFPLNPDSRFPDRYRDCRFEPAPGRANFSVMTSTGVMTPDPPHSQKAGVDSGPWLAAVLEGLLMIQRFDHDPGDEYPDGGLSATCYMCADYAELEVMSPIRRLGIGESIENEVRWDLLRLPDSCRNAGERREAGLGILRSDPVQ
jgi:hypothetical protein